MSEEELAALAADIKARGLIETIVLLDGCILDGRNRHRARELAGVEPRFEDYAGADPTGFVLSRNLHRRHDGADPFKTSGTLTPVHQDVTMFVKGDPEEARAALTLALSNDRIARGDFEAK